jgi:hypothetical protein
VTTSKGPRVAIAGGGIAGLTVALRLAERGYQVTLYEQKAELGGSLASRRVGRQSVDVYPHMFLNWYHNFWQLIDDVNIETERDALFMPLSNVKQLRPGQFPHFSQLTDTYSAWHLLQNLFSGLSPPADMFVFAYSTIDLLAERLNPTTLLDQLSVNGFLHSRPYMTPRAAQIYDAWLTMVWSAHSYMTSASAYQRFVEFGYPKPVPAFWLLRGPSGEKVIEPLAQAVRERGGTIETSTQVTRVSQTRGTVTEIDLQATRFDGRSRKFVGTGPTRTVPVDDLVLAVPPAALSNLVRAGDEGHRVVDVAPGLSELARLNSENIPIVALHLNSKLPGTPKEPVGLLQSCYSLSFTDISQVWTDDPEMGKRSVLCVSASDVDGLPGTGPEDDGFAMIKELGRYLPGFDVGTRWGESADIDWTKTVYTADSDARLFLNEPGSENWRPSASCDGMANLVFAGDFCMTDVDMATVEAAVMSGLNAAQLVVKRRGVGQPVNIVDPRFYPEARFVLLRYALAPYAYAAKAWSMFSDAFAMRGPPSRRQR